MSPASVSPAEVLEELVHQAEAAGASDVHLQRHAGGIDVSLRLDGVLAPFRMLPQDIADRVFGRIKYLARLKTYQDSMPQDGRIHRDELRTHTDVRVATYPAVCGEKIVLRLFGEAAVPALEALGFDPEVLASLRRLLTRPAGLLLLTGPAGSGKSTTIHACLSELAVAGGRHIITVEDPVERLVPGVMQTEVNEGLGLTFAAAARHLLRQDPQVLALGEVRDEATAEVLVRAALTGHLTLSTLHAGSCAGVVERLLLLCQDRNAALSSLAFIINQRLVRRLCSACRGDGCNVCLGTGYRGRLLLAEAVEVTPELRLRVRDQGAAAVKPLKPLGVAARELVANGATRAEECNRVLEA